MNPTDKPCWNLCLSCHRCADKGKYSKCYSCSGRQDPHQRLIHDPDDYCDCRNGILRWVTKKGQHLVVKIPTNPFEGKVKVESVSESERDWNAYLNDMRERLNDPEWDPLRFSDGSSVDEWTKATYGI